MFSTSQCLNSRIRIIQGKRPRTIRSNAEHSMINNCIRLHLEGFFRSAINVGDIEIARMAVASLADEGGA